MTGFGIRDVNYFVISGELDGTDTECIALRNNANTAVAPHHFISSQSTTGN